MVLKKRKRATSTTKKGAKETKSTAASKIDAVAEEAGDVDSDDQASSDEAGAGGDRGAKDDEDDDFFETPDEKRVRLAKDYLRTLDGATPGDVQERLSQDVAEAERRTRVHVKDFKLGEPTFRKGHKEAVTCICFSEDGNKMFTGGKDCAILRWDVETGSKDVFPGARNVFDCGGHFEKVQGVCLLERRNLCVSVGVDRLVRLWDWRCAPKTACVAKLHGHTASITDVAAEVDGSSLIYTTSLDKSVKIWDVAAHRCVDTLLGHVDGVGAVDIYSKGRPVTGGADKTVRAWKVDKDTHLMFSKHTYAVDAVVAVDHERLISGSQDGSLHLWSHNSKKPQASVSLKGGAWVTALGAIKGGDVAFSGDSAGELQSWHIAAGGAANGAEGKKVQFSFTQASPLVQAVGCINAVAVSQRLVACAIGKEHKLGSWFFNKKARNGVLLLPLAYATTQAN